MANFNKMRKEDLLCCSPIRHCCGGYSEHNNCCPHNNECGDLRDMLCSSCLILHTTNELKEQIEKIKSRIAGNENVIAENYEKCSDAIENISREQQEIKDAIQRIVIGSGSVSEPISIPTRLSQLINDSGFVTESRLNNLIHTIVAANDYITRTEAQQMIQSGGSASVDIPTKLSQFTNDLGFVTESRVIELLQAAGLNSNGTITQQFKNAIDNAGFVTQEELAQAFLNAGYTTSSDIQQALQNAGYATQNDIQQALNNANYVTETELQQAIQNASIGSDSTSSVSSIKVGDTTYNPSSGVISLPAYPTSLPSSDVSAWAKASTKPSYTYPEIGYTVNSITSAGGALSLAGTTPLHIVNLTGNVSSLTLSSNPVDGHSCHVIFSASAEQTVVIAHDATNRVCPGASDISLTIPAGGYVEIDFLASDGKVYVRGV